MKILHICGNFIGNNLYQQLFKKLNFLDVKQFIYVPVKSKHHIGLNKVEFCDIQYELILKPYHRVFYFSKINKIYKSLLNNFNYDLIHAHTLFSDGGVAYKLHKKFGVNYIVNIRNTDINIFYKYFIHLRFFAEKILLNSKKIVLLSKSYLYKFIKIIPKELYIQIKDKISIVPNGVHQDYFISRNGKRNLKKDINIVSIGRLDKNKNMISLLNLIKSLKGGEKKFKLHIIGDGPEMSNLINFSKDNEILDDIIFYGKINRKEVISILDNSDIFMLLSKKETFGIAYIEALARGLPVIYTQNEGIDGYFTPGLVGYPVNPSNLHEIRNSLFKVIDRYSDISSMSYMQSTQFNWDDISKIYFKIYQMSY